MNFSLFDTKSNHSLVLLNLNKCSNVIGFDKQHDQQSAAHVLEEDKKWKTNLFGRATNETEKIQRIKCGVCVQIWKQASVSSPLLFAQTINHQLSCSNDVSFWAINYKFKKLNLFELKSENWREKRVNLHGPALVHCLKFIHFYWEISFVKE